MTVDERPGPDGSLVGHAVGSITRLMRDNDLMPGDRLPSEAELARQLQVSRTVVREAFRSLAAMRIIELATGRRATVARIDHGPMSLMMEHGVQTEQINIQQIYDVRRTIEMRIATLAALRRTEAEAQALAAEAAGLRATVEDPARMVGHDLAFHAILADASRNPVYALIIGSFRGVTSETWAIGWRSRSTPEARERMLVNHERIAAAVAKGDPEAASAAMSDHFDESVRALIVAGLS
ncbi:MAG: FadR family transcriptional regulator [Rubellimicrobium sp.]|nr:FadR family transcriptional regulator [Rubellimicrobium sp.]